MEASKKNRRAATENDPYKHFRKFTVKKGGLTITAQTVGLPVEKSFGYRAAPQHQVTHIRVSISSDYPRFAAVYREASTSGARGKPRRRFWVAFRLPDGVFKVPVRVDGVSTERIELSPIGLFPIPATEAELRAEVGVCAESNTGILGFEGLL